MDLHVWSDEYTRPSTVLRVACVARKQSATQCVSALAGPREVLVSSTVKDLVAGSGIAFADRGSHVLKGVPGEWRVFAVET
jgi:class 3 adenylate cyclase